MRREMIMTYQGLWAVWYDILKLFHVLNQSMHTYENHTNFKYQINKIHNKIFLLITNISKNKEFLEVDIDKWYAVPTIMSVYFYLLNKPHKNITNTKSQ